MKEKCPWLEQDDERRNMSDREILDKYIDLEKKSCLSDSEKKQEGMGEYVLNHYEAY